MHAELNSNGHNANNLVGYPGKPSGNNSSYAFFTIDTNWKVVYWNEAAENILGVPASDIVGHSLKEKYEALLPESFDTIYQHAFLQDRSRHAEQYWGAMENWSEVVSYYDGISLSVSFNILSGTKTNNDKSQALLRKLTEWYSYISEVTGDALWERNFVTGEIYWIDGGHKRLFGYRLENALVPESFWVAHVHPADKKRVLTSIMSVTEAGTTKEWECEYRFERTDGSYADVHDRGHIFYEKGKPLRMIGATQDITQKIILKKKLATEQEVRHRATTEPVIDMQQTDRSVIAQVLQEQLNQILVAVKMYLGVVKKYDKYREIYLDKSLQNISHVIDQIRKMHNKLALPNAKVLGLFDNICLHIDEVMLAHRVEIDFWSNNSDDKNFTESLKANIYRIVQEQLAYQLQYADATRVVISIVIVKDILILYIGDNGVKWAQQTHAANLP